LAGMYLRRCYRAKDGKRHAYWALMESYRTERGPRQRMVAYLGDLDEASRLGIQEAARQQAGKARSSQRGLFEAAAQPRFVEVDPAAVRVAGVRDFGGPWLGLELARRLGLTDLLGRVMPTGQEEVPWPLMSLVLVLSRLCDPSSELYIAEHGYDHSAMADLLGVPAAKVNDDRLYRALDALLPHKAELEKHLRQRLGELFDVQYDLLLYDMTSTYFEGQAEGNPLAKRGYSRDQRPDCKQVCIALVVSRCGLPLGYEVFAGNKADVSTLKEIVTTMEGRHGKADRIWVVDRGMVSKDNIEFLKGGNRRYILGTPKSQLKRYEKELATEDWMKVHEGLEVKKVAAPDGEEEVFILCRSADRREKEKAMHERFFKRIQEGLETIAKSCQKKKQSPVTIARRVGKLLGQNTRASGAFEVNVGQDADGRATLTWLHQKDWNDWASLSEGCYMLRSNVTDWSGEELWKAYMQLTEAEGAFRIHKSDLALRPVWHQKEGRVRAHILVCFLAYVLWKTLGRTCRQAGLGDEPRKVFDELARIKLVDVLLPTRCGKTIHRACISRPDDHQAILLLHLKMTLPSHLSAMICSEDF
jgi:transposase